jgi:hypothetical protein
MATEADLFKVLHRKSGLEVLSHTWTVPGKKLRVVGRVPKQGMNVGNYLILVHNTLAAVQRGRPWSADISDVYMLKNDKVVFARRWLLQADELEKHFDEIIHVLKSAPVAQRPEPEEVRLYGRSSNDTAGGRRGAGPVGSVAVGPLAVMRKGMGG